METENIEILKLQHEMFVKQLELKKEIVLAMIKEKYRVDDIKNITKIEIHGGAEPVCAFLEIVEDETIVAPSQLGVNKQAFDQLNLPEGANVTISLSTPAPSVASIKRKISGKTSFCSDDG